MRDRLRASEREIVCVCVRERERERKRERKRVRERKRKRGRRHEMHTPTKNIYEDNVSHSPHSLSYK